MSSIWQYYSDNQSQIDSWLRTTLQLAVVPVIIALVISLPLGWIAARYRWSYPPIITLGGLLYTIPSVILFLVIPGIIGTGILDPINVEIALTLYCIALLVRVVADGLNSVSRDTLAAAAAMGLTSRQRLFSVQLPLAVPVIAAGLRVAAVSNVSLVSVASAIGVSQLGSLFTAGYNAASDQTTPILLGLIMFIVIALVFDGIILVLLRIATPWRRAVAGR